MSQEISFAQRCYYCLECSRVSLQCQWSITHDTNNCNLNSLPHIYYLFIYLFVSSSLQLSNESFVASLTTSWRTSSNMFGCLVGWLFVWQISTTFSLDIRYGRVMQYTCSVCNVGLRHERWVVSNEWWVITHEWWMVKWTMHPILVHVHNHNVYS